MPLGVVVAIEEGCVVLVAGPSDVTSRIAETKIDKVKGAREMERYCRLGGIFSPVKYFTCKIFMYSNFRRYTKRLKLVCMYIRYCTIYIFVFYSHW